MKQAFSVAAAPAMNADRVTERRSAGLRMERAQETVATLEAIGIAAAVLNAEGRVLAVNALLEALSSTFLSLSNDRLVVADAEAHALFRDALGRMRFKPGGAGRFIPVVRRGDGQPSILRLLPLDSEDCATQSGGDVLAIAAELKACAMVPSPKLLTALFNLSPSEAKLAAALARGRSLKHAAADLGVTFHTARTYAERILHKTATRQQSELVALLKSASVISACD